MITAPRRTRQRTLRLIFGVLFLILGVVPSLLAVGGSVTLAWDRSEDSSVIGYRVRYGVTSGEYTKSIDIGNSLEAKATDLTVGDQYYFVVTAYDASGLESEPSNEVAYLVVNRPPSVSVTSPVGGTNFNASTQITVSAAASDEDGRISKVEFYSGSQPVATVISAPYTATINNVPEGNHTLKAVAYDDAGGVAYSQDVPVNVVRLRATAATRRSDGSFEFKVTGAVGRTNKIWASSDLQNWTLLAEVINTSGALTITDPEAATLKQRFYKVTAD